MKIHIVGSRPYMWWIRYHEEVDRFLSTGYKSLEIIGAISVEDEFTLAPFSGWPSIGSLLFSFSIE